MTSRPPTAKLSVRTDRVLGQPKQVCEKWTLTGRLLNFPDIAGNFPDIQDIFPDILDRELRIKLLRRSDFSLSSQP
jgi:hypothetical protein